MPIHNRLDLSGQTFDGWTVIGKAEGKGPRGEIFWNCRCECGNERRVVANSLYLGKSTNCGCRRTTHGHASGGKCTRAYHVWAGLHQRCYNKRSKAYKRYGARGIVVCERWHDFKNFLEDMGEPPEGKSLDRTDNDGPYSPENCVWASPKEQIRNRSTTVRVPIGGRDFSVAALADALGMSRALLSARLENGWSVSLTLTKD